MKLAFDIMEMRPGCVTIAAALGGDLIATKQFPGELWLAALTPGMALYEITPAQLASLVESATEAYYVKHRMAAK